MLLGENGFKNAGYTPGKLTMAMDNHHFFQAMHFFWNDWFSIVMLVFWGVISRNGYAKTDFRKVSSKNETAQQRGDFQQLEKQGNTTNIKKQNIFQQQHRIQFYVGGVITGYSRVFSKEVFFFLTTGFFTNVPRWIYRSRFSFVSGVELTMKRNFTNGHRQLA